MKHIGQRMAAEAMGETAEIQKEAAEAAGQVAMLIIVHWLAKMIHATKVNLYERNLNPRYWRSV